MYQCRCWTKEGERCSESLELHKARVAQEVHALFLDGTHELKQNVTTMTISNVCPMCETFFPNLATARIHIVKAFRSGRCFVNRSARALEWEEKTGTGASFACPDPECPLLFNDMSLLRCHIKREHFE